MKKTKIIKSSLLAIGLVLCSNQLAAQSVIDKIDVSIFPKAEKGMVKHVIEVPHSTIEEDNNKKIEIIVGKYVEVDKCNRHFLAGELSKKDLKGFGYDYYQFSTKGDVASTLMGCGDTGKINKFVSAQPYTVGYNGRLPIVIYTPEGYDVQFKVYKSEPETYRAQQVRSLK